MSNVCANTSAKIRDSAFIADNGRYDGINAILKHYTLMRISRCLKIETSNTAGSIHSEKSKHRRRIIVEEDKHRIDDFKTAVM